MTFGVALGDMIGSVYEFTGPPGYDVQPLLRSDAFFTDDTVLTVATYEAIVADLDFGDTYRRWVKKYPMLSYGGRFREWAFTKDAGAYNSKGNGAAMRVLPCALVNRPLEEKLELAKASAKCTHNHPDGLISAQVVVHIAHTLLSGEPILKAIQEHKRLHSDPKWWPQTFYLMKEESEYSELAPQTIRQALSCLAHASSFEDAMRRVLSINCDTDTVGAIVGGLAEIRWGIPYDLLDTGLTMLPGELRYHCMELSTCIGACKKALR